jgi:hypothetical protein
MIRRCRNRPLAIAESDEVVAATIAVATDDPSAVGTATPEHGRKSKGRSGKQSEYGDAEDECVAGSVYGEVC